MRAMKVAAGSRQCVAKRLQRGWVRGTGWLRLNTAAVWLPGPQLRTRRRRLTALRRRRCGRSIYDGTASANRNRSPCEHARARGLRAKLQGLPGSVLLSRGTFDCPKMKIKAVLKKVWQMFR